MDTTTAPDRPPADVDRLVDLVGVVEQTQRAEDVDGFLALFSPDAARVTGGSSASTRSRGSPTACCRAP
ncbi:hypothetical protein [Geodermatophilus sp. SYSU D00815]